MSSKAASFNVVDSCGWLEFFADGPNLHWLK
jgi:hypothetical protein